jgi:EmrB/QacA subfamily drug resistance transporter
MERKWWTLLAVCVATFMLLLDITVVNVALPDIQSSLGASLSSLQWVVDAYSLTLAALMLTAGSFADRLGRRRVFTFGFAIFTIASFLCGISPTATLLNLARGLQGVGGAAMFATSLALIAQEFHGRERGTAVGAWGATIGGAVAIGPLIGGALTEGLGWEWIFFVNVPVGAAVLLLTLRLVPESKARAAHRSYDPLGAVAVVASLMILVFAISKAEDVGWATFRTIGLLVLSGALLGAFLVNEARVTEPLMPFSFFRIRTVAAANLLALLLGASVFANFFLLTLYVQQVLGFSPMRAAVSYLPMALALAVGAGIGTPVLNRYGPRPVLTAGPLVAGTGLALFARIHDGGGYLAEVLPAMLAIGFGLGVALVAVTAGSVHGVPEHDSGLASGLFNTAIQIGGGLGLAVLGTVAAARTDHVLAGSPQDPVRAMTEGFATAMTVGGGLVAAAALVAFAALRGESSV